MERAKASEEAGGKPAGRANPTPLNSLQR